MLSIERTHCGKAVISSISGLDFAPTAHRVYPWLDAIFTPDRNCSPILGVSVLAGMSSY